MFVSFVKLSVISSVSQARMAIFFLQALPVFKGAIVKSDIFVNSHAVDLKENAGKCHSCFDLAKTVSLSGIMRL